MKTPADIPVPHSCETIEIPAGWADNPVCLDLPILRTRPNLCQSVASVVCSIFLCLVLRAAVPPVLGIEPSTTTAPQEYTNSPVERFKDFLSNPPAITNLLLQRKVPMGGGRRAFDGSLAFSTEFAYYQARWQPGGVFFRKLSHPSEATNVGFAGDLVSSYGETNWMVDSKPIFITWNDPTPSAKGKNFSVYFTRKLLLEPLRQALNLGVLHLDAGAIRWNGNEFHLQSELDTDAWVVGGKLVSKGDGPPDHLGLYYSQGTNVYRYVVRYGYEPPLRLPYVPTVITNFWISSTGQEYDIDEWKILDLAVAPNSLPESAFAIEPFLQNRAWPVRVYKDHAFYELSTNGTLRLLFALSTASPRPAPPGARGARLLYAGWLAVNFALFALFARVRNMVTTSKPKERQKNEIQT
jgi:hypothetical protein